MLAAHVRAILNHLRMGYAESDGSWENALCLTDGNRMLRMRFMVLLSSFKSFLPKSDVSTCD